MRNWLRSDLIGIPVTLFAFGIFALTVGAFYVAGPLAGVVFSLPVWVGVFYLAFKRVPSDLAGIHMAATDEHRHRVLVIADQGLEDPALIDTVTRRGELAATEVMIVAPVVASSPSHALADEIDREARGAERRLEQAIRRFDERGVPARGHVDNEGDPMQALVDGLREFPANEVMLIPGAELGWHEAELLGERIKREVGVPVTELGRAAPADAAG